MKKISLIIFSIYTVFLVLFITFGSSAAAPIYVMMSKFIKKTEYNIRNIEFDLSDNYLISQKAGTVDIMISLENGFNQTYTLILKNELVSPKLEGLEIKNGACDILIGEKSLINFVFPNDAKYKQISVIYDNSCLTLTKTSELQYQLEGIKVSSSVIKVIVDDGENKIETTYTINVNENKKVLFFVKSNLSTIVPKIMGHLVLFIVEGILALWVTLYYLQIKKY